MSKYRQRAAMSGFLHSLAAATITVKVKVCWRFSVADASAAVVTGFAD
jgi:hypothetical protein